MKITKDATQIARAIGSSTTYNNSGGALPAGTDTIQEAIDAIAGGMAGLYLTVISGGQGTVQALGTLGATETIDLANANAFWGTLNANCTITTTGWTNLKDCQILVELIEDGTGGWTPTFPGVTWIGGTPTWDTTASTVTHVVLFSRDGGTTIYGATVGAGGSGSALTIKDEGSSLATAATSLDFVGAGVTASGTGAAKTITIPSTGIQLASIAAASSAIAATEAVVVSASLPANSIVAGNSYRITGAGVGTTGVTPGTDAFRIRIGPTTLTGTIPTTVSALGIAVVTAQPFRFEAIITLRTSGGSGTIIGECVVEADNVATGRYAVLNSLSTTTASVAVDTTVANLLELTFQSGNAGSSNTFHVASIEQLTVATGGFGPAFKYLIRSGAGDYTTSSTSKTPIDSTNLGYLTFTLAVGDVVRCVLTGQASAIVGVGGFDFEVDQPTSGNVYIGNTNDRGVIAIGAGNIRYPVTAVGFFVATEAGIHGFRPVWIMESGGTSVTLYNATSGNGDTLILFSAEKLGASA